MDVDVLPHDEAGDGPAVVLLHAGVADRGMWAEHLPALAAAGYRAIAPDLPGFAAVPMPAAGDSPWAAVLRTLDALGVERAVLAGVSFGGAVALRAAAVAPERVSGLLLVSAPPLCGPPSAALAAAWEAEEAALEAGDIEGAVAAVVDAWTLPGAPAALRERVATMQRHTFERQAVLPDPGASAPDPVEEDPAVLAGITAPVLVAAGEHDLPDFRRGAQELAQLLPGAGAPVVIPGAGHLAPLETPQAFRALLLDVLAARG